MANEVETGLNEPGVAYGDLLALIEYQAARLPQQNAIMAPGRQGLSYTSLRDLVHQVGGHLRALEVMRDARVAVVLPNGPEMATAFLAVACAAACAPLNPAYQAEEFSFYLQDIGASALVLLDGDDSPARSVAGELGIAVIDLKVSPERPAGHFDVLKAESAGAVSDDSNIARQTALILHTSGTTSRPKIVPLTHANLVSSAVNIARFLELNEQDRCLNVMPLFHIHGLVGALLASLAGGGSLVCTPGFEVTRFFDYIRDYQPTWYSAVPTIHQSIVSCGSDYKNAAPGHQFRFVRSSSAALPPRTLRDIETLFKAPVVEAYGMTEASHQMASNPLPPAVRKPGSVGVAAGVDIAIMDQVGQMREQGQRGEIVIRGVGVTTGYENNPEANATAYTDGWFRTGDQGYLDEDGYLFITGRLKEIVNRGGEKISPREVDEALLDHPAVAQATAFAVPHATLGEDLVAAVVLRAGESADEAALRAELFNHLADFKVPSRIVFLDEIPKGPTGKIQRTTLHEKLAPVLAQDYAAPETEHESYLAELFIEVLDCGQVGVNDNFFALGGDSLRGTQVVSRINLARGVNLPIPTLFQYPTVAQLAVELERAEQVRLDELVAEIDQLPDDEVARLLREHSE